MHLPDLGALFARKYQLLELLGEGGFARVYLARDTSIGRDVAIKILTPTGGGYPERVQKRFVREARVISELRGEFTITMFDFGTSPEGLLYMVFEFVQGVDLKTLLSRENSLAPDTTEHILRQMLKGLAEAHSLGVLHRDIKPGNVLVFEHLDDPFRAKLIDFGIAKLFTHENEVDLTKLTADGSVVGTLRYLAPEQFYGEELAPSADLYSAGLVALEMLMGTFAVAGSGRDEVLRNQLSPEPLFVPDTPGKPQLAHTLRSMVARRPEERPRSAGAALRMLDDASFSGSTSGPYVPRTPSRSESLRVLTTPTPKPSGRGGVMVLVATLSALAAIVGGALWFGSTSVETQSPPATKRATSLIRSPEPPPAPVEPETGPPQDQAATIARGCEAPETGFWSGEFFEGLEPLPYHVYVPERPSGERLPTVLVVHRLFGDDREFISETRFHEVAEEFGFILISMRWSGDPDIEHMSDRYMQAYETVQQRACVDGDRLFAVGHAGGGRHVRKLRCIMKFSAIASTSDGHHLGETNCESDPVPILQLWGRDDPHLPRDGTASCMGKRYLTPSELLDHWRALNGCGPAQTNWAAGPGASCEMLSCDAPVVLCLVDGGFDWPHAPEPIEFPGCKSPPMELPVGRTIWKFFAAHGQPLD